MSISPNIFLALQLQDFLKVPSAPLDHQSCGLTGPEAFVFRLPPGRVSRLWKSKLFSTQRFQRKPKCCGKVTCISIVWIICFLGWQVSATWFWMQRISRNLPRTLSRGDTQWDPRVSTETNGDWKLPALSAEDGFTPKFFRTCGPCYVIIQVLQWLRLGIQTNSREVVKCPRLWHTVLF